MFKKETIAKGDNYKVYTGTGQKKPREKAPHNKISLKVVNEIIVD
jgi:hypothetical protein